jgi:hypothetical protein
MRAMCLHPFQLCRCGRSVTRNSPTWMADDCNHPQICGDTPAMSCGSPTVVLPLPTAPPSGLVGPNDYYQYLSTEYTELVSLSDPCYETTRFFFITNVMCLQAADPTAILLREQNARSMSHISTAWQNTQLDMFKFTDKLLSALRDKVNLLPCPRIHGLSD